VVKPAVKGGIKATGKIVKTSAHVLRTVAY
jgi:hypothetical protein